MISYYNLDNLDNYFDVKSDDEATLQSNINKIDQVVGNDFVYIFDSVLADYKKNYVTYTVCFKTASKKMSFFGKLKMKRN